MKKLISLFLVTALLFTFVAAFSSCDTPEEPPAGVKMLVGAELLGTNPSYVKWEGRYDFTDAEGSSPAKLNFYHTASGFTVTFVGTALWVEFDATVAGGSEDHYPYYNVAVDNEVLPTTLPERTFYLTGGQQRVAVVEGLPYGEHTVTCLKMSEPYDAVTSVLLIETDGNLVERDTAYDAGNFKFMVICASGGSGHGALGYSDDGKGAMGRNTANSSSLHAFNYLTARMFGADVQFVANSGWGVSFGQNQSIYDVLDYSGITTSNNVAGAKQTAPWNHQSWVPDVILFNIGGNDTTSGGFDQATYQKEVVEMVEKLHALYPNAYMIWTHTNSNAGKYAVSAMNDKGILKQDYMKVAIIPKVGADGTVGANGHNSMATHIATAEILAETLESTWGFTRVRQNVTLEEYAAILKRF